MGDDQPYDEEFWGKDGLEPYRHIPVSRGEIRCMVLEPGRGNKSLRCTLEVKRLADDPQYEAISYVWGRSSRCHKIRCDGRRLFITPSLRDALRQCRLPDRSRVLWADSVCIDQDADEEKSHQVRLMSEIYSKATRVLICLGPDRPGGCAQQVQSFLHDFNQIFERTLENISGDWDSFPTPDDDDPLLSDSRWPSWDSLVKQPWFVRGWVVQEAGLARDALLLWGPARIPWLWIQRCLSWRLRRVSKDIPAPPSAELHLDIYKSRCRGETITMWVEDSFFVPDLIVTLHSARRLDVTDPRDRIYAFLGLPEAADIRDGLNIDYEKTWETVFQDFACCYLDRTHNLRLLHFTQPTEATLLANAEYPSWIPQWQRNIYYFPIYHQWQHIITSQDLPSSPPYSRQGNGVLKVRGLIMDSVAFLSPLLSKSTTISEMAAVWKAFICYNGKPIYEKFPPIYAFLEAMQCGWQPAHLSKREAEAQTAACLSRLDYGGQVLGGKDSKVTSDATGDDLEYQGLWKFIQGNIHNRHIGVTRRGYYCLVPQLAQEGDICAVIFGTTLPFILRRAGGPMLYKVVGEAFVTSSREIDWEADETPYRVGSRDDDDANEDWMDMGLEEEDILLC